MKIVHSPKFCEKYSNINFHENPSSGSLVDLVRTEGRVETGCAELMLTFGKFSRCTKQWDTPKLYINIQSVPRSKHTTSLSYNNQSVNAV